MLAEAQTLASLRHPCVVALFGILQDEIMHCQNHQINKDALRHNIDFAGILMSVGPAMHLSSGLYSPDSLSLMPLKSAVQSTLLACSVGT